MNSDTKNRSDCKIRSKYRSRYYPPSGRRWLLHYCLWQRVMDVDLNAYGQLSRMVLPKMISKGCGRIISCSRMNAERGYPRYEELVKHSDNELEATVVLKIEPVKAKFSGQVILGTRNAPDKFSLAGAGDGGVACFAKGGADIELISDDDNTLLRYKAKFETGGKIVQLGSRLITSSARKL